MILTSITFVSNNTLSLFLFFYRCYNCGEFANHLAAKCTLGPQPKRCHHCKSADHLIADCPLREEKKKASSKTRNGDGDDHLNDGRATSPSELDSGGGTPGPQDPGDGSSSSGESTPPSSGHV